MSISRISLILEEAMAVALPALNLSTWPAPGNSILPMGASQRPGASESTAQDGCRHIGAFLRQGRSQGHAQSRTLEMGAGHSVSGYGARSERTTSEKSALLGIARAYV